MLRLQQENHLFHRFFSSKPAVPKATGSLTDTKPKPKLEEKVEIKPEVVDEVREKKSEAENKKNRKRTLSQATNSDGEAIPGTPQDNPTQKKKKVKTEPVKTKSKAASNRSRILQICDSSSDEEDIVAKDGVKNDKDAAGDADVSMKEKENKTPPKNNSENNDNDTATVPQKRRFKTKRMVTKTYEDEDGYINTVREMEEVSCSEDETEKVSVKATTNQSKHTNGTSAGNLERDAAKGKKKVSPPNAKKQGTILSFFTKK